MNVTSIRIYPLLLKYNYVNVENYYGEEYLELPLTNISNTSPYIPQVITGLEAPELVNFNGPRSPENNFGALNPRVIDALIILNPANSEGKTVSELRDYLYKVISPRGISEVEVRLMNGTTHVANVKGKVTRAEPDLFSNGSKITLSIECENPMFISPNAVHILDLPPLDPSEYPTWFDTEDETLIIFKDEVSTAPHGISFTFRFHEEGNVIFRLAGIWGRDDVLSLIDLSSFSFTYEFPNPGPSGNMYLRSFYGGLDVYIAWGAHAYVNLSDYLDAESILPSVQPGINAYSINVLSSLVPDQFELIDAYHYPSFWGI